MVDGRAAAGRGAAAGDAGEDLFQLGALLTRSPWGRPADAVLAPGRPAARSRSPACGAAPSWPALAAPRRADRYATAADALRRAGAALRRRAPARPPGRCSAATPAARARGPRPPAARERPPRWQARVGRRGLASPVIAGDLVIAATADGRLLLPRPRARARPRDGRLGSAVESSPAAGRRRRSTSAPTTARWSASASPRARALSREARRGWCARRRWPPATCVVVGMVDAKGAGALVALDAKTASRAWTRKLGAVFSSPALAGAARARRQRRRRRSTRSTPRRAPPSWSQLVGPKVRATPAVGGETGVRGRASTGRVVALRAADGDARPGARARPRRVLVAVPGGRGRGVRLPRGARPRPRPGHGRGRASRPRPAARGVVAGRRRRARARRLHRRAPVSPRTRAGASLHRLRAAAAAPSSPRPRSTGTGVRRRRRRACTPSRLAP